MFDRSSCSWFRKYHVQMSVHPCATCLRSSRASQPFYFDRCFGNAACRKSSLLHRWVCGTRYLREAPFWCRIWHLALSGFQIAHFCIFLRSHRGPVPVSDWSAAMRHPRSSSGSGAWILISASPLSHLSHLAGLRWQWRAVESSAPFGGVGSPSWSGFALLNWSACCLCRLAAWLWVSWSRAAAWCLARRSSSTRGKGSRSSSPLAKATGSTATDWCSRWTRIAFQLLFAAFCTGFLPSRPLGTPTWWAGRAPRPLSFCLRPFGLVPSAWRLSEKLCMIYLEHLAASSYLLLHPRNLTRHHWSVVSSSLDSAAPRIILTLELSAS